MVMEKIPYGNTGHKSSRILFGAAAIGGMRQEKADSVLQLVLDSGINHIDVAASYGEAEIRLAPCARRTSIKASSTHGTRRRRR